MTFFNRSTLATLVLGTAVSLLGTHAMAAQPKHSKVEVSEVASCTESKGATKERVFKVHVKPNDGLVVNMDGPWSLTVKNPKGVTIAKPTLAKGDFDKSIPGFKLPVSCDAAKGSFDYQIMAFVCTKDKKLCYFDRHEGSHSI